MIDFDPVYLAAAIALCEPLVIRTIAFDVPAFNRLKDFQRKLQDIIRRDTGSAEVQKHLILTHPEVKAMGSDR